MFSWFYRQEASVLIGFLFALFFLLGEAGYRLGSRSKAEGSGQSQAIEAAILTLFGLLLAFTFSLSSSRYEARKSIVLEESNAIGTAHLRAGLLSPPAREAMREALRGYLGARLEYYNARFGDGEIARADAKADGFQKRAWALGVAEARQNPTPVAALVVEALNQMIDVREKQAVAFENVVPQTVLVFLLVLSLFAMATVGWLNGLAGSRHRFLSLTFAAVVAITLYIVVDLDRPRRGPIRLTHETLTRLSESLD